MENPKDLISISIVSHKQASLVGALLEDILRYIDPQLIEIILTLNVPERHASHVKNLRASTRIIENKGAKGFATNHNAAFKLARGDWFCVMNPDIRLMCNPFPPLLEELQSLGGAVIAPAVVGPTGLFEDNVRDFPTMRSLAAKLIWRMDGCHPGLLGNQAFFGDWVAGMFMLFRRDAFGSVGGFDEKFFLYYEDVDICARLWRGGWSVVVFPGVQVIHHARRTSRHHPGYMRWHLASMIRFFLKHHGHLPQRSHS